MEHNEDTEDFSEDDVFLLKAENIDVAIRGLQSEIVSRPFNPEEPFGNLDILEWVSLEEARAVLFRHAERQWDGSVHVSARIFSDFLAEMRQMNVNRGLEYLVKTGEVEMAHDGEDFVFRLKEDK